MRLLLADPPVARPVPLGADLDPAALARAYAAPPGADRWLRVNMVTTLDGAATGSDGRSGSINTEADHTVFELLRALSDVVLIGSGTARTERYGPITVDPAPTIPRSRAHRPTDVPLAVVTNSGSLPDALLTAAPGRVLAVTHAASPGLADLREALGPEHVVVAGDGAVDLAAALATLADAGLRHVLSEGGPHLLGSLLAAGLVDELDLTWAPLVVAADRPRIVAGPAPDYALHPRALVEQDGTIMGRWLRRPTPAPG